MREIPINLKLIPIKIKKKILPSVYKKLHLVGYKKILDTYKVPIIQLTNHTRIWILEYEIK
uniref:Cytochrome b6-f complex subunit PetP n=1 Tax=Osmundaria fimbriata TaxID=228265 RepID=A0A1Z1M489_OSMFI|nr:cytochrome b6-f complex subunit PetP [Osmundaria fimbriata]ARW60859.1 cytochrome b6-f complex subunit PetP [Osmundaria fimbriata]